MGNSKDFRTDTCDVWAESQRLRSIIFRSLVLKAARRLRASLAATSPSDLGARELRQARPMRRPQAVITRLFRQRHVAFLPPPRPIKNAPLAAIVAAFVLMHVFAGVMLIHAAVAVVNSAQSEARPSLASNRNDDLGDQAIIHNGARK
jgi:hypothetical protein